MNDKIYAKEHYQESLRQIICELENEQPCGLSFNEMMKEFL